MILKLAANQTSLIPGWNASRVMRGSEMDPEAEESHGTLFGLSRFAFAVRLSLIR